MKTIWNAISFLAIVHLFVFLLFAGWLAATDRLDSTRFSALRDLFAATIPEQVAVEEAEQAEAKAELKAADVEARLRRTPMQSAEQIRNMSTVERATSLQIGRMKDDRDLLLAQVAQERQQLEQSRTEFEQEQADWKESIREELERKTDEQFARTVKLYESQPPEQAKALLKKLVARGQQRQAVAYLNAMKPDVASKILREFEADPDVELAADLLEDLRTFGLEAKRNEGSADADSFDNPASASSGAAPGA